MSLLVDVLIIALLVLAALTGVRRGAVLIFLELTCFALATVAGFVSYRAVGGWVAAFGLSRPLANDTAFTLVWVVVEVAAAIAIRQWALPHLKRDVQLSRINQIGGSILNMCKTSVLVWLGLVIVAAVPLSAGAKNFITNAYIARHVLQSTSQVQHWLGASIGQDLSNSLNFYTISSDSESTQHINLGFTTTGTVDQSDEAAMLELINQERTSRGLPALTLNAEARTVARAYSLEMFAKGYFSHIDPQGHNPFQRLQNAGVHFNAAGENLALAPTLQEAHQGLMNSPGHRANILSPNYHTVGIGIIASPQYGLMVTQDFTD